MHEISEVNATAEKFLTTLYGDVHEGCLTLWESETKKTKYFKHDNIKDMVNVAMDMRDKNSVYFGIGARSGIIKNKDGRIVRGSASDVSVLPCLWMDFDILGGEHKKENLPTRAQVNMMLDSFPLPPSIINHSGGGLHCYWVLDKPVQIEWAHERDEAQELSQDFQNVFIDMAREIPYAMDNTMGLHVDDTASLAMILRVPDTYNHKRGTVLVETEQINDNRYSVQEIKDAIASCGTSKQETAVTIDKDHSNKEYAPLTDVERVERECQFIKDSIENPNNVDY